MIRLTRINRVPLVLNSDLIEHVEVTPDTVISMVSGQKFIVLESADEVIGKVKDFRRSIASRQEPPVVNEPAVMNEPDDDDDSFAGEEQS
jgi:flagellar protein FlbD